MSALIGRTLQIIGMIILPIALYIGLAHGEVRREVGLLAVGGFVYLLGWIIGRER